MTGACLDDAIAELGGPRPLAAADLGRASRSIARAFAEGQLPAGGPDVYVMLRPAQ